MIAFSQTAALDRMLDPVLSCFDKETATRLVALRADATTQSQLDDLAARHQSGQLSTEELAAYDTLVNAGAFVAVLQAKARRFLQENSGS